MAFLISEHKVSTSNFILPILSNLFSIYTYHKLTFFNVNSTIINTQRSAIIKNIFYLYGDRTIYKVLEQPATC